MSSKNSKQNFYKKNLKKKFLCPLKFGHKLGFCQGIERPCFYPQRNQSFYGEEVDSSGHAFVMNYAFEF